MFYSLKVLPLLPLLVPVPDEVLPEGREVLLPEPLPEPEAVPDEVPVLPVLPVPEVVVSSSSSSSSSSVSRTKPSWAEPQ